MKRLVSLVLVVVLMLLLPRCVFALEDPLATPNNKFGIHILFPDELKDAARLVNTTGGDWGYIVMPIQSGDKNRIKWQKFMTDARNYHIIPIIRLATEGDYFNTKVWRKPTEYDILDFANFLNSLDWPTKNRYILFFNEPNRGDEWGGNPDPNDYAELLSYGSSLFKSLNENFFVISAGLDNASVTGYANAISSLDYLQKMNQAVPGIYNKIDALGSHSYPNPAFSQPPTKQDRTSVATFRFEQNFVEQLIGKKLPIFITETGWTKHIGDTKIPNYYKYAFESVWNDPTIVAVTPFIFKAGAGPFEVFSFLYPDGSSTPQYKAYAELPKVKGEPPLGDVLGETTVEPVPTSTKSFKETKPPETIFRKTEAVRSIFKWLLKI